MPDDAALLLLLLLLLPSAIGAAGEEEAMGICGFDRLLRRWSSLEWRLR